jgi:hypothetical protein
MFAPILILLAFVVLGLYLIPRAAWFKALMADGAALPAEAKKASVHVPAWAAILAVLVIALLAGPSLTKITEELVVYSGLALVRLVAACAAFAVGLAFAVLGFQWWENTALGHRLQAHRGVIFVGFLVAAAIVFHKVVL